MSADHLPRVVLDFGLSSVVEIRVGGIPLEVSVPESVTVRDRDQFSTAEERFAEWLTSHSSDDLVWSFRVEVSSDEAAHELALIAAEVFGAEL